MLATYALLYRTEKTWRITVGSDEGIACGALERTPASARFERAAAECGALLADQFGVTGPVTWQQSGPGRWAADFAVQPSDGSAGVVREP